MASAREGVSLLLANDKYLLKSIDRTNFDAVIPSGKYSGYSIANCLAYSPEVWSENLITTNNSLLRQQIIPKTLNTAIIQSDNFSLYIAFFICSVPEGINVLSKINHRGIDINIVAWNASVNEYDCAQQSVPIVLSSITSSNKLFTDQNNTFLSRTTPVISNNSAVTKPGTLLLHSFNTSLNGIRALPKGQDSEYLSADILNMFPAMLGRSKKASMLLKNG